MVTAGLSCAATGPACVEAVEGALGIATIVSADGNPTNEIQTINTGIYTVYQYVENGIVRYYGITNNFFRRAYQHSISRGWSIQPIQGLSNNLSKSDAKAVEQVLIEQAGIGNLLNKINSIASTNPIYSDAIIRGRYILESLELLR